MVKTDKELAADAVAWGRRAREPAAAGAAETVGRARRLRPDFQIAYAASIVRRRVSWRAAGMRQVAGRGTGDNGGHGTRN